MAAPWRKLFPQAQRSQADFLIDGEAYFAAMVAAIETARTPEHYIYILGWMLDIDLVLVNGQADKTLFRLLSQAAGRGVEIRILVWQNLLPNYTKMHSGALPRLQRLANTQAFLDPHTYFPDRSKQVIQRLTPEITRLVQRYGHLLNKLDPNQDVSAEFVLRTIGFLINAQTLGAHHEKNVIVRGADGLIAFCGGTDINRNRVLTTINNSPQRFPYYHDTACRLQGPAAHTVLQRFIRRWRNHPRARGHALRGQNEPAPKAPAAPAPYTQVVGTYNSPVGSDKDRSLSEAYFAILNNARAYIYIEDQYLVNLDVARALNRKIKEPRFQRLTFAIQDSIETADIFIPNRKRGEFYTAVLDGTNQHQKDKVLLAVIDRTHYQRERYHPGLHAKTLIVDDEIAIIGSANVNQRSFTIDSETSVVVFNEPSQGDKNFAAQFRTQTWKGYLRKPAPAIMYESAWNFPNTIQQEADGFAILVKYTRDAQLDLDVRIQDFIRQSGVAGAVAAYYVMGKDLRATQVALHPQTVTFIFDELWEYFVDPKD